jgi:hypothetical protein
MGRGRGAVGFQIHPPVEVADTLVEPGGALEELKESSGETFWGRIGSRGLCFGAQTVALVGSGLGRDVAFPNGALNQ